MYCKCLIIETDTASVLALKFFINTIEHLQLDGIYSSLSEASNHLATKHVDLAFLNINELTKTNTQSIKHQLYTSKIIITSHLNCFAQEAFSLNALDYLLKPINYTAFLKAINKFIIAELQSYKFNSHFNQDFIYLRSDRKMVKIHFNTIVFIESFKDYIVIHREPQTAIKVKQSLCSTACLLPKHEFMRVHRSFIIATSKITAFTKFDIELGERNIPIGRNYTHITALIPKSLG